MSAVKDAILARACKPAKAVTKVVAVRVSEEVHAQLTKAAEDAGIKPGDIVRAAIEEFCKEV